MSIQGDEALAQIRRRAERMRKWLGDEAPYVPVDQNHLDPNTPEQAYWRFGYYVALTDVMHILEHGLSKGSGSKDISA